MPRVPRRRPLRSAPSFPKSFPDFGGQGGVGGLPGAYRSTGVFGLFFTSGDDALACEMSRAVTYVSNESRRLVHLFADNCADVRDCA